MEGARFHFQRTVVDAYGPLRLVDRSNMARVFRSPYHQRVKGGRGRKGCVGEQSGVMLDGR